MLETTQDKLQRLLSFRSEMEQTLRNRISELLEERRQLIAEYDAEIDKLKDQLRLIGISVPDCVGSHSNGELVLQRYLSFSYPAPGCSIASFRHPARVPSIAFAGSWYVTFSQPRSVFACRG